MKVTRDNVIRVIQKIKTVEVFPEADYYDLRLREDLGLDSLDYISMIFELERAFNIEIPQNFEAPKTLDELVLELNKLCKQT
jgi:acyl carrier protein